MLSLGFNISRKFIRNVNSQYTSMLQFVWSNIMLPPSFPPSPLLVGAGPSMDELAEEEEKEAKKGGFDWDGIIYFAVPKKKVIYLSILF